MNAQLKTLSDAERASDDMKRLIFEAMQIVSGQTMKQGTSAHVKALLEERSNLVAMLYVARDGLVDASAALYGNNESMAKAVLQDVESQLKECDFLNDDWVSRVLRGESND